MVRMLSNMAPHALTLHVVVTTYVGLGALDWVEVVVALAAHHHGVAASLQRRQALLRLRAHQPRLRRVVPWSTARFSHMTSHTMPC